MRARSTPLPALVVSLVIAAPFALAARRPPLARVDAGEPAVRTGPARPEESACDVVVMLSGREYGMLKPCGCTHPQTGGLERRAVLWKTARAHAKASFAVSIGDTLRSVGGDLRQAGHKADLFRAALESMDYAGQLLGPSDLDGQLASLWTPYGAAASTPRPPLNAMIKRGGALGGLAKVDPTLRTKLVVGSDELPVRAVSVIDPTERSHLLDAGIAEAVLPPQAALAALAKEPGLLIVAAHVMREDLAQVVAAATAKADFVVVVDVLGEVASRKPLRGATFERGLLVTFDEHGKEAGLLRLTRVAKGFVADYDSVALDPEPYDAPDRPEFTAISALFDVYRRRLEDERILERIPSAADAPGRPAWVGSAACAPCHPGIYAEWKETPHARAMATLSDHGAASDPECVVCHTVGWVKAGPGGFERRASSFQTLAKTPGLVDVGCEACHGPGSLHVAEPSRKELFGPVGQSWNDERMWRAPTRSRCRTCHDLENSHGFNEPGGPERYLESVDHRAVRTGRIVRDGAGAPPPGPSPAPAPGAVPGGAHRPR